MIRNILKKKIKFTFFYYLFSFTVFAEAYYFKSFYQRENQDDIHFFSRKVPSTKKLETFEEFYHLYYLTSYYDNHHLKRNIFWLQKTLKKPFAPPIQALVISTNIDQYRRYQRLIKMQVYYLLTKNYVLLAARFDKHYPVFFNKKYSKENLRSLNIAKNYYQTATTYWKECLKYHREADKIKKKTKLTFIEDLFYRIKYENFNYNTIIRRKIAKVEEKKDYFKN